MKNNLITASALLLGCQSISYAKEQPNIVILFVDDLGWADLGYNNPVFDTPNINKLKSDGLYFSRAYVASATSSPSRASLMTGKESLRCGFVRHIYGKDTSLEFETFENDPGKMKSRAYLPLEEITYAERLKDFGYYNMFVGKWHLGTESYFPTKQGFDAMYGTCEHGHPNSYYQPFFKTNNPFPKAGKNDYLINMVGNGAVDFINKYDKKAPFLLNVWYYGVHGPQIGRKDLVVKYEKTPLLFLHQGIPQTSPQVCPLIHSLWQGKTYCIHTPQENGPYRCPVLPVQSGICHTRTTHPFPSDSCQTHTVAHLADSISASGLPHDLLPRQCPL